MIPTEQKRAARARRLVEMGVTFAVVPLLAISVAGGAALHAGASIRCTVRSMSEVAFRCVDAASAAAEHLPSPLITFATDVNDPTER